MTDVEPVPRPRPTGRRRGLARGVGAAGRPDHARAAVGDHVPGPGAAPAGCGSTACPAPSACSPGWGLVTMVLLLGSLLFGELWRRGDLLPLTILDEPASCPTGSSRSRWWPSSWRMALIVWGALDAAPACGYGGRALPRDRRDPRLPRGLRGLRQLVARARRPGAAGRLLDAVRGPGRVGAAVAAAGPGHRPAAAGRRRCSGRSACWAFAAMVVAQLGMDLAFSDAGFRGNVQSLIHSGFTASTALLLPLVFITAVAIVDFATDVSTSLAEPVRSAPARLLTWLKAGAAGGDPGQALVRGGPAPRLLVDGAGPPARRRDQDDPGAGADGRRRGVRPADRTARTGLGQPDAEVDEVKERLTMTGAFVLSSAVLGALVLLGLAQLILTVTEDGWAVEYADRYPVDTLSDVIPIVASLLCLGFGIWLLRTGSARLGPSAVAGAGVGAAHPRRLEPSRVDRGGDRPELGFSYPTIDVGVTLVALGWLLVRWRRVDTGEVSLLLAVVVFSWLVISRGDYLSFLGGLLGLPGVVVVVFGILYTLLSGSGFTTESSKRLPRESRTLMFVGYLLLSVTILNWLEVIHEPQSPLFATSAFYFLGLPLAVWLLVRRVVPRQLVGSEY